MEVLLVLVLHQRRPGVDLQQADEKLIIFVALLLCISC